MVETGKLDVFALWLHKYREDPSAFNSQVEDFKVKFYHHPFGTIMMRHSPFFSKNV